MSERTSTKSHYATVAGRLVIFMARPSLTRQKAYREPVIIKQKRYRSKQEAVIAAKQWEGVLV